MLGQRGSLGGEKGRDVNDIAARTAKLRRSRRRLQQVLALGAVDSSREGLLNLLLGFGSFAGSAVVFGIVVLKSARIADPHAHISSRTQGHVEAACEL
jgi:hypothetical protein